MVKNEAEEGGALTQPHARHIKKKALKNKALSVSFNEKDLRFSFKLSTNLIDWEFYLISISIYFLVGFFFFNFFLFFEFFLGTM